MEKIDPSKLYSVNQIDKNGWIFGLKFMAIRKIVLSGGLPAIHYKATKDAQVRYKILGQHIINYIKQNKPK